jgi:hypothetical protein
MTEPKVTTMANVFVTLPMRVVHGENDFTQQDCELSIVVEIERDLKLPVWRRQSDERDRAARKVAEALQKLVNGSGGP